MHIIFEVLWFESRLKLGGYSETETRRIGLFRYLDDARAAGEEALDTRYDEIASKTYSREGDRHGAGYVFRSNVGGYEEHRFSYRIDEVELK